MLLDATVGERRNGLQADARLLELLGVVNAVVLQALQAVGGNLVGDDGEAALRFRGLDVELLADVEVAHAVERLETVEDDVLERLGFQFLGCDETFRQFRQFHVGHGGLGPEK